MGLNQETQKYAHATYIIIIATVRSRGIAISFLLIDLFLSSAISKIRGNGHK